MVQIFNLLDGIVVEGELFHFQVFQVADLRDFVFIEGEDGNFSEVLKSTQRSNPIFRPADLSKIQKIGQGLKTLDVIFIETNVFQIAQIFYSRQRVDAVAGKIKHIDVGERVEEGNFLDFSKI